LILLGDSSKTSPPINTVKFEWIAMDLHCEKPYSLNIRHIERGLLERVPLKTPRRLQNPQTLASAEANSDSDESEEENETENQVTTQSEAKPKSLKSSHCVIAFSTQNE